MYLIYTVFDNSGFLSRVGIEESAVPRWASGAELGDHPESAGHYLGVGSALLAGHCITPSMNLVGGMNLPDGGIQRTHHAWARDEGLEAVLPGAAENIAFVFEDKPSPRRRIVFLFLFQ